MHSPRTLASPRAQNRDIVAAVLDDGNDVRIRLTGASMKPIVRTGSVLEFSPSAQPVVGDIVLMSFSGGSDQKLVAHRIQALDEDRAWTKGDSNGAPDPPVARSQILACATRLETRAGTIPLRNSAMRALGRLASRVYPVAVRAYRRLRPADQELECAS